LLENPIALLVEAADDMVYCVVDLEDGIKRKVLQWTEIEEHLRKECSGTRVFDEAIKLAREQIGHTDFSGPAKGEAMAQTFRIAAISEMAIAAKEAFAKRYEEIMHGTYNEELLLDRECEAMPLVRACKAFGLKNLYTSSDILKLEIRGRHVIHDLMDLFWEAVENLESSSVPPNTKTYPGKLYHLISDNYRRVFEKRLKDPKENARYCKLQLVTDYIAGMTDPFACRLHKELING
jgi:dGTPase